jgi:hypothetical protein
LGRYLSLLLGKPWNFPIIQTNVTYFFLLVPIIIAVGLCMEVQIKSWLDCADVSIEIKEPDAQNNFILISFLKDGFRSILCKYELCVYRTTSKISA